MILFPAIDLRAGRCVRLKQGDPAAETLYSDDPTAMASHWASLGAEWLHIVNLDGAFTGQGAVLAGQSKFIADFQGLPINLQRLVDIRKAVDIPIQFGGGLRQLDDVALALELGATRVVLGTAAVRKPEMVVSALKQFGPDRIVVGIDAREGIVATDGWREQSQMNAVTLGRMMAEIGVTRGVFTDIRRDGMLSGVNVMATAELARETGLRVIASGGVRDIDDIENLIRHRSAGIEGVIIGKAIYSGHLDFSAALRRLRDP